MGKPGLYIVTLNNDVPISVNANDPRLAEACVRVTQVNCKFGNAKDLVARRHGYEKVFGRDNVNFRPIAELPEPALAERVVLKCLDDWRIRGRTGRKNEWLVGISGEEVERIALSALVDAGIPFRLPTY